MTKSVQKPKQEIEETAVYQHPLENSENLLQIILDTIDGEVFVKDIVGKYLIQRKSIPNSHNAIVGVGVMEADGCWN